VADKTLLGAFAISLLLHFFVIATVEVGRTLKLWNFSIVPKWMQSRLYEEVKKEEQRRLEQARKEPPKEEEIEIPMIFVEVNPEQAEPQPPKDAKYYSSQNSLAANPDSQKNLNVPKIEGRQEQVPKTVDVLKPEAKPLQPAPPPPQKQPAKPVTPPKQQPKPEPPKEELKPRTTDGDLLVARATPKPQPDIAPQQAAPQKKPRTLAEARAQKGIIEGQKMRQEGGVPRLKLDSSLNVRATPFGAYDAAFIAAVQARWFSLLDEKDFVRDQTGTVVLDFRLNKDGRITSMHVADASVSDTLSWICQRAVLDPAPYAPFPPDLKALLKNDFREVRFTFYYNQ
jgi:hypothetical protein